MCERAASATPRSRRKEPGGRSTRFLNVGWEQRIQLCVPAKPRTRASATRRHLSGPEGSGGPQRGGGGEGPWRQPRASRLGLGVSGSSMATRRLRATRLTPHFQIKMAQAPGLGREAGAPSSYVLSQGLSPGRAGRHPRCGNTPPGKA